MQREKIKIEAYMTGKKDGRGGEGRGGEGRGELWGTFRNIS